MSERRGLSKASLRELRTIAAPLLENQRRLLPLGLVLLLSFAYFVAAPAWNQNSRLALTRALVEDQTTVIDRFHVTTGDKSFRDGHFYSDKAPGASLLAAPVYAVFFALRSTTRAELPDVRVHSLDPRLRVSQSAPAPEDRLPGDILVYNQAHRLALYLCGLFTVALASMMGVAAVFVLARRLSGSVGTAIVVGLTYGLGTPAFTYSTALYGHQLSAALLIVAFTIVVETQRGSASRALPCATGIALGLAVLTEYTAAPVVAAVVLFAALRHGPRFAAWVTAGGVPVAAALAGYHAAAFGNPLATGYDFVHREEFAEGMRVNYGIGLPDPSALLQITFGSYRGLFYLSPVLLLAAWGLASSIARGPSQERRILALALAITMYFVLLNAGYYMWDGGASAGPRHLVPALPFLALGLVAAWRALPKATATLSVVSVAQMLLLTAASPEVAQFGNPLWEFAVDRLVHRVPGPEVHGTNLGLLLGLPGPLSLAPLLLLWWWGWSYVRSGFVPDGND